MGPTTLFDVFWRIRRKANYDDADTFVLGAESEFDARGFGQSLILVTDATVASSSKRFRGLRWSRPRAPRPRGPHEAVGRPRKWACRARRVLGAAGRMSASGMAR